MPSSGVGHLAPCRVDLLSDQSCPGSRDSVRCPSTTAVALAPAADRNQASDLLHETARADDLGQPPQDTGARLPPKLRREMGEDIAEGAGIGKAQRGFGRGEV